MQNLLVSVVRNNGISDSSTDPWQGTKHRVDVTAQLVSEHRLVEGVHNEVGHLEHHGQVKYRQIHYEHVACRSQRFGTKKEKILNISKAFVTLLSLYFSGNYLVSLL